MIRAIRQDDAEQCAQILCAVYNNETWRCHWDLPTAMAYLKDLMSMPKFFGYAAEEGGCVVGAIFAREKVWWNNSEVYVEELFVSPNHQGKGYGTRLLGEAVQYVRQKGLAGITLLTNRYAPAANFYRRNGFTDCEHLVFMCEEIST